MNQQPDMKPHYAKTPKAKTMRKMTKMVLPRKESAAEMIKRIDAEMPVSADVINEPFIASTPRLWNLCADETINNMLVQHELAHWALGDPVQGFHDHMNKVLAAVDRNPPGITKQDAETIGWINVALDEQARADELEAQLAKERERAKENWEMLTAMFAAITEFDKGKPRLEQFLHNRLYIDYVIKWGSKTFDPRHYGEDK
jgi:hypothetical protein